MNVINNNKYLYNIICEKYVGIRFKTAFRTVINKYINITYKYDKVLIWSKLHF